MKTQQIKSTKPMKKPPSLTKRIILASDEGKSPQEIAELLGASLPTVYTARSVEKKRRGGSIGTEHWFHQEIAKETARKDRLAKAETDWEGIVKDWNEVAKKKQEDYARNHLTHQTHQSHQTQLTPSEPARPEPFTLPFFSRIKAAYAVLRGV
jgi:hypothetical protein